MSGWRSRAAAWSIFAVVGVTMLSGCGGSKSGGAAATPGGDKAPSGKLTISILGYYKKPFDKLTEDFMREHPDVKVDVSYAPAPPQLFATELQQMAAGGAPDIITTMPGRGTQISSDPWAEEGKLAPLEGVKNPSSLIQDLAENMGKTYSYTGAISVFAVAYNKKLFKELGVEVPKTFEQLLGICRTAKNAGKVGVALPAKDSTPWNIPAAASTQYVPENWPDRRRSGETFASMPGWAESFKTFTDLRDAGCLQDGATSAALEDALPLMVKGKALMMMGLNTPFGTGLPALDPDLDWAMFPLPPREGRKGNVTVSPAFAWSISADAKNPAAAQAFIQFLAEPKNTEFYARSLSALTQKELVEGRLPERFEGFGELMKQGAVALTPSMRFQNGAVINSINPNMQGLITGKRSIPDVIEQMDRDWDKGPKAVS